MTGKALIVQDLFLTETARLAQVVLPVSSTSAASSPRAAAKPEMSVAMSTPFVPQVTGR